MERRHALYIALCAATVFFCFTFVAPAFYPLPVYWYYPLEHRWALQIRSSGLAMDWYGRTLWAFLDAGSIFPLTYFLSRRLKPASARTFGLWAAWTATAVAIAMTLHAFQLAYRQPIPEPLPRWYVPK